MGDWHLAQMNVATALYDMEDGRMAGFADRLAEINALADAAPGFIWRLQDDAGDATSIRVSDDPRLIVNLSVWISVEALHHFAYRTAHAELIAARRDWFHHAKDAYQALWWIPTGTLPTPDEGLARIERLRLEGPTETAFTFKVRFPMPASTAAVAT